MYYDHKKPDVMNWRLLEGASLVEPYGMPQLAPVGMVAPQNLVPFHHIGSEHHKQDSWFHFYVDDYRFERLWRSPEKYLPNLLQFAGGFAPDFSMLLDQPRGQQIGNAFRNFTLAYWLQVETAKQKKSVIPNACFSDAWSYDWVFAPLPERSAIAITTQGCMRNYVCKQALLNGIHELMRQKYPTQLVVYGQFPDEWIDRFSVPVLRLPTFSNERWVG